MKPRCWWLIRSDHYGSNWKVCADLSAMEHERTKYKKERWHAKTEEVKVVEASALERAERLLEIANDLIDQMAEQGHILPGEFDNYVECLEEYRKGAPDG